MNKQDVDKVSSQLNQAIRYFSPFAHALNDAAEVFDALANAIPHKNALDNDVEKLKSQLDLLGAQLQEKRELIQQQDALVALAKEDASKKIADTIANADEQVVAILASIKEKTQEASDGLIAKQTDFAKSLAEMQKDYDAAASEMATKEQALLDREQSLTSTITALETKLEGLKKQAQKFAAAFSPE
jgi:Asp-tRNA(Asn)/Glu-tRNA(Gln) amidotransferase A subunit family amidase